MTLSSKIAPSHGDIWIPSNSWLLGPVWTHNPNCITIGSAVFAQVTAECPYILQWATLSPKLPLPVGDLDPTKHMISLAHSSPQPKQHLDWFCPFCTDDCRVSLYFTMGCSFPLSLDPHLIHGFLGPPESSTQTASRSVQQFLQGSLLWQTDRPTDRSRYSVCNNRPHLRKQSWRCA